MLVSILVSALFLFAAANPGSRYERMQKIERNIEQKRYKISSSKTHSSWFYNPIDHEKPSLGKFSMRYWWDSNSYKPGGPIIFYLSGEAPASARAIQTGTAHELSKRYGGVICTIEHRYYGKSTPYRDFTSDNLRYLSSKQAIADNLALISAIRNQTIDLHITSPSLATAKVIVVGGSYAGNLAAWMRELYPEVIYAAYASSAPVLFREDFYEYAIAVDNGIPRVAGGSQDCVDGWKKAIDMFDTVLITGSRDEIDGLKMELGLPYVDDYDLAAWISEIPAGSIQYGPDRDILHNKTTVIAAMCSSYTLPSISLPGSTEADRFVAFKRFVRANVDRLSIEEKKQVNVDYYVRNTKSAGRLWWYQSCTEFGYWQIAEPEGTEGGSVYTMFNTVQWNRANCAKLFGEENSIPKVAKVLDYYGGGDFSQDRILWVNGGIDPWRYLGFLDTANSTVEQPILHHPAFHCSDLRNGDVPGTRETVTEVVKIFDQWLL